MTPQRATHRQMGTIHFLAGKAGLDETARRGFMQRHAGVTSTKQLTPAAANDLIQRLQGLVGRGPKAKGAVAGLDTPVARKLRALWIAGHDLGLVRDRTDRAMLSFLERQTGVAHVRFLAEPTEARSAIEALKSMLARAGVRWPAGDDVVDLRRAIVEAQWARCHSLGNVTASGLPAYAGTVAGRDPRDLGADEWLQVQRALGRRLRGELERQAAIDTGEGAAA